MPQNARDLFHGRGFQLPEWVPWAFEYIQYFDSQSYYLSAFGILNQSEFSISLFVMIESSICIMVLIVDFCIIECSFCNIKIMCNQT